MEQSALLRNKFYAIVFVGVFWPLRAVIFCIFDAVVLGLAPHHPWSAWPCRYGASRFQVNQPAQLALGRKKQKRGPEAQTCALLGLGRGWNELGNVTKGSGSSNHGSAQANDLLRVLRIPGAWPLIAAHRQCDARLYNSSNLPAKSIQMQRSAK